LLSWLSFIVLPEKKISQYVLFCIDLPTFKADTHAHQLMPIPVITLKEASRERFRIYYRVFVDDAEKASFVFTTMTDLTVHGEAGLKRWCELNLTKLDSGAVVEARFD